MSLVDFLHDNRTPMELAKELARSAHENAALRDKLGAAELELFWMKAAEREPVAQASAVPASQGCGALCAAIVRACEELPDDYGIELCFERGHGGVYWNDPRGESFAVNHDGDNMAPAIHEAIEACQLAATQSNKGE